MSTRKAKAEEKRRLIEHTNKNRSNGKESSESKDQRQSNSSSSSSSGGGSGAPPPSYSTHQTTDSSVLADDHDAAELNAAMSGGASGVEAVGRALATRGVQLLHALPQLPPLPTLQSLQQQPSHADDPVLPIKCAIAGERDSQRAWLEEWANQKGLVEADPFDSAPPN